MASTKQFRRHGHKDPVFFPRPRSRNQSRGGFRRVLKNLRRARVLWKYAWCVCGSVGVERGIEGSHPSCSPCSQARWTPGSVIPPCHSGEGAPESSHIVHPAPNARHSGAERLWREGTESSRSNQKNFTTKSGSIQTASASTPSQGITPKGWIPGPLPRNDITAEPSADTPQNGDVPLSQNDGQSGSTGPKHPIRVIRVIRGQNIAAPECCATPTPPPPPLPQFVRIRVIRGQNNAAPECRATPTTSPLHHLTTPMEARHA